MGAKEIEVDQEFFDNFTSIHTRKSYKSDLAKFIDFIKDAYPKVRNLNNIERVHIINYRNFLSEVGGQNGGPSAPKTIARKLASISSYFDYLVERRICDYNPTQSVKRPRREVVKPTNALNAEQVRDILESIETNNLSGALHKALLTTFFTTGLRKSEILNIKYSDIKKINDLTVLEFKGKGGKRGQKVLHPMCLEALETYFDFMKGNKREHKKYDWLFQPTKNPHDPKNLNKPLNPKTINQLLDKYALKTGLNFSISPHSARATFIGELLENGVDIYSVAQEVNHSSVTTTQEYDKRRKNLKDSPIMKLKY